MRRPRASPKRSAPDRASAVPTRNRRCTLSRPALTWIGAGGSVRNPRLRVRRRAVGQPLPREDLRQARDVERIGRHERIRESERPVAAQRVVLAQDVRRRPRDRAACPEASRRRARLRCRRRSRAGSRRCAPRARRRGRRAAASDASSWRHSWRATSTDGAAAIKLARSPPPSTHRRNARAQIDLERARRLTGRGGEARLRERDDLAHGRRRARRIGKRSRIRDGIHARMACGVRAVAGSPAHARRASRHQAERALRQSRRSP